MGQIVNLVNLANLPPGVSGRSPRNAAFMRQSGVKGRPCRMNAAFRPAAALCLGAVIGSASAAARPCRLAAKGQNESPQRLQALDLPGPHVYHAQIANSSRLPTPSVWMTITGVS